MRDLKGTRPIVGTRQAAGSTQTSVPIILAQDADPAGCAVYFMHDFFAPCEGLASRRAYALAALYVATLLKHDGQDFPYSYDMLATVLCSALRMRRSTSAAIIAALIKAGMLVKVKTTSLGGVVNE